MGQKISPISLRIGKTKPWAARWFFAGKGGAGRYPYAKFLEEDEAIRKLIRARINQAGIAAVEIERTSGRVKVFIKAARPGLVIGQGGKGIEELTRALEAAVRKLRRSPTKQPFHVSVTVEELKRRDISASYVAQQIAWDLEKRLPFRRVIKKHLDQITQNKEVRGAKIYVSGRLNGADISRSETAKRGSLPLQTLRADIDYGVATAFMTYGTLGVKVWIYKGEVFKEK